jgi:hypothetical protein
MVTAIEKRKAAQKRRGRAVVAVRAALNGNGISTAAVDNMPCLIGPGGKHILVVALPDAIDTVATSQRTAPCVWLRYAPMHDQHRSAPAFACCAEQRADFPLDAHHTTPGQRRTT